MKKILLILACVLTFSLQAQTKVKMITFNLRFGELATLEELATVIREQNPDYVALQEVDVKTARAAAPHQNGKDFLTELAAKTGMFGVYGKTIPHAGGYYGIGLLSRYPLVETRVVRLPSVHSGVEPRVVLYGITEGARGTDTLAIACTHLDYTTSASRLAQIAKVKEVLESLPYPVLLGGDFNALPDAPEIRQSLSRWSPLTNGQPTFPSNEPREKIDYIFGYPAKAWTLKCTEVLSTRVSDHFPVVSVVEWKHPE
ncbi:MAG: endonuclease/exonuclease/phosphatase family protein [Bacteroidales bacterium]